MKVVFELSMPNKGSWDNKWSGEGNLYAKVKTITVEQIKHNKHINNLLEKRNFDYRWDDGWCARVSVYKTDAKNAKKIQNNSLGFCGYDWMIDSLLNRGYIDV